MKNMDIHALASMNIAQLRHRWLELFGEATASRNKVFLRRRLAWRLQSLQEGTLSERALRRAEQIAQDADLRTRTPSSMPCESTVVVSTSKRDPRLPMAGTVLIRDVKGLRVCVTVLEDSFEYAGKVWPSLFAIAKEVTGTRWNGFIFFGLKGKSHD